MTHVVTNRDTALAKFQRAGTLSQRGLSAYIFLQKHGFIQHGPPMRRAFLTSALALIFSCSSTAYAANWASVSDGWYHTVAIKSDGTLWAWGRNNLGQLGLGDIGDASNRSTPTRVGTATNWSSVSGGAVHTLAIKADGTLWAWGYNYYGQLGIGNPDITFRDTPTQAGSSTNWASVSGGENHTLAVKTDGTLWAWGYNIKGQLGLGDTTNRSAPTRVGTSTNWSSVSGGGDHSLAIKTDGTLWAWGDNFVGQLGLGDDVNRNTPTQVGTATNWASVSGGGGHTLAIKTDGTLWAWGYNLLQQLGLGLGDSNARTTPTRVGTAANWASVSGGGAQTLAIKTDGTLWAWGNNFHGQLGHGDFAVRDTPTQVGASTNWASVPGGGYHSRALKTDGTLWAWGLNSYGQLGLGDTLNRNVPTRVAPPQTVFSFISGGGANTLAIKSDGTLWVWGYEGSPEFQSGQLGLGVVTSKNTPTQVGSSADWAFISGGAGPRLAIKTNGTLWAWGANLFYQLGLGDQTNRNIPTQVGSATNWSSVFSGQVHSAAIKTNGTLWAWGHNGSGELGLGDTTPRTTPTQVGTATDWAFVSGGVGGYTLAIKSNGTLWAWGHNGYGQLGLGDTANRNTPTQVGFASNWSSVATGILYSLAVKTDGTLWAWGINDNGQLGLGDTANRNSPTQVGIGSNWSAATGGARHTLGLKSDKTLWAWGLGEDGQLGLGDTTSRNTPTQVGSSSDWTSISAGDRHSLAKKTDGTLWTWGWNGDGQLGVGKTTYRFVPLQLEGIQYGSFSSPPATSLGNPLGFSYTVSDVSGPGLKMILLWRANDEEGAAGTWAEVNRQYISGNVPLSGSISDTPPSAGAYWYGTHVYDAENNLAVGPTVMRNASSNGDIVPPALTIKFPASGTSISGITTLTGVASDDKTLMKVEVQVGSGSLNLATGTNSWSYLLNSSLLPNGWHNVTVKATDSGGNIRRASIFIEFNNVSSTCNSADVSGSDPGQSLNSTASISDQCIDSSNDVDWFYVTVANAGAPLTFGLTIPTERDYDMELFGPPASGSNPLVYIKGSYKGRGLAETILHTALAPGTYAVRVYGEQGDYDTARPYSIAFNPPADTTPPTVAMLNPTEGSTAPDLLTVSGTASDTGGLSRVEIQVDDGAFKTAAGTTSWTFPVYTTLLLNGAHTIRARATDLSGNPQTTTAINYTVNHPASSCAADVSDVFPGAPLSPTTAITNQCISLNGDADWFYIDALAGTPLKFDLAPPAGRNYDFALYGPDAANPSAHLLQTAAIGALGQAESISYTARIDGRYAVKAYGNFGDFDAISPYSIQFTSAASSTLPDLTISATVGASFASSQANVSIPVTVSRSGGSLTNGTFVRAKLYWSTNNQWDAGDKELWSNDFPITTLNTTGSSQTTAAFNIYPVTQAATYFIIAYADPPSSLYPNGAQTESAEANNIQVYPIAVAAPTTCGDGFTNHTADDTARSLTPGIETSGMLCSSSEVDVFKIEVPQPGTISLQLEMPSSADDYDMQLLTNLGTPVTEPAGWSKGPGETETITCPSPKGASYNCPTPSAIRYYIKVRSARSFNGSAPYRLSGTWPAAGGNTAPRIESGSVSQFSASGQPITPGEETFKLSFQLAAKVIDDDGDLVQLHAGLIYMDDGTSTETASGYFPSGTTITIPKIRTANRGNHRWQFRTEDSAHNFSDWQDYPGPGPGGIAFVRAGLEGIGPCGAPKYGTDRVFLCEHKADKKDLGGRKPLIFIHGICSVAPGILGTECEHASVGLLNPGDADDYPHLWDNLIAFATSTKDLSDKFKPYVFRYETAFGVVPPDASDNELVAGKLRDTLEAAGLSNADLHIVAHSNGGLVSRAFMQKSTWTASGGTQCGVNVNMLITLATPHQGTNRAILSKGELGNGFVAHLLPDSAIDLEGSPTPIFHNRWLACLNNYSPPLWVGLLPECVPAGSGFYNKIRAYYTPGDLAVPTDSGQFLRRGCSAASQQIKVRGPFNCGSLTGAHGALAQGDCFQRSTVRAYIKAELLGTGIIDACPKGFSSLATPQSSLTQFSPTADLGASLVWSWEEIEGATSYRVADLEGNFVSDPLPAGTSTWLETGLTPNTAYERKVFAYDSSGLLSTSLSAIKATSARPVATNNASLLGLTKVKISWQASNNPADTAYEVLVSTLSDFSALQTNRSVASGSETEVHGLRPGTTYYFAVQALNRDGLPTIPSLPSTATTPTANLTLASASVSGAGRWFAKDLATSIFFDVVPDGDSQLFISTEPLKNPVEVSSTAIVAANQGLLWKIPTSFDPAREFVLLSGDGVVSNGVSGSITIPYRDDDDDGYVDGASPAMKVDDLRPYTLVGTKWTAVPGALVRDTKNKTVTFSISHLSVYTLNGPLASVAQPGLNTVRAYPIPWKPGSGGRFDTANGGVCGRGLIFDNLIADANIRIYNMLGDLVRDLGVSPADSGCKAWDGKNDSGVEVASGIYVAVIKGAGGKTVKKLAIER